MLSDAKAKVIDLWDEILERIPESYLEKRDVPGVQDVEEGLNVRVPTTIYAIKGDDTSGVAGLLLPSGEFIQAAQPNVGKQVPYWEPDETLVYERFFTVKFNETGVAHIENVRVIGNSWTEGEVIWDGVATGSVVPNSLDGEEGDEGRQLVNRRTREQSLTGDWQSTGELWRAIRRGTSQRGTTMGIQHLGNASHQENKWDTFGDGERKAA